MDATSLGWLRSHSLLPFAEIKIHDMPHVCWYFIGMVQQNPTKHNQLTIQLARNATISGGIPISSRKLLRRPRWASTECRRVALQWGLWWVQSTNWKNWRILNVSNSVQVRCLCNVLELTWNFGCPGFEDLDVRCFLRRGREDEEGQSLCQEGAMSRLDCTSPVFICSSSHESWQSWLDVLIYSWVLVIWHSHFVMFPNISQLGKVLQLPVKCSICCTVPKGRWFWNRKHKVAIDQYDTRCK